MNQPVGLDVFGSSLFWISQTEGNVKIQDKFGRGVNHTLVTGLLFPFDVKVFQQQRYDTNIKNPCPTGTQACFPLCLLQPGTKGPMGKCACPDKHEFVLGSNSRCNVDAPEPTIPPITGPCSCQNGGYCDVVGINRRLQCICPPTYYGIHCELSQNVPRSTYSPQGTNPTVAPTTGASHKTENNAWKIGLGLGIVALLLIGGIAVIVVLYLRGSLGMKKSGHGEFRAGAPGMNGANSANGGAVMDPMSVQYSASESNVAIANPTYDKVQNGTQANVDHEYATITPGGINISMEDPPRKQ
jgi:hypothetical protein